MPRPRVTVPQQRHSEPSPAVTAVTGTPSSCPCCGSERLTSLGMTLTDGTPVGFFSCRHCEHRAWSHEGGALALSDVLSRTRKQLQD